MDDNSEPPSLIQYSEDLSCGFIAIVGRPNVGKSTLLNSFLGQKVSITSKKPQTTRHRILGVKHNSDSQLVFVDTPGIHQNAKKMMNRHMNKVASATLSDVDCILFLVEAGKWTEEDDLVLQHLQESKIPVIMAVNKIDLVKPKERLLDYILEVSSKYDFIELVPVSAGKSKNLDRLEELLISQLPRSHAFFPKDQITDRSNRFLAAEIIREKLMRQLGQELPYALTVEIEQYKDKKEKIDIAAKIWVERDGQKAIVIGSKGANLKKVGTAARKEMEYIFDNKVFLKLWVKVKAGWSDDQRALKSLGYIEE